jgi:pre-rRNA-processing protein TSR3
METFTPTLILRHRRENLKKCSLRGLETRADIQFISYPHGKIPPLDQYVVLTIDAPPLTAEDAHLGLFLIDGTWRYAQKMIKALPTPYITRSLPSHIRTAYPRRQDDCPDPERGLASIEALFIAYQLTGRDTTGLLDNYHWKDRFLNQCKKSLESNHEEACCK